MFRFNRGELSQALAQLLGFKGLPDLSSAEEIVPTINVGDLNNSPYLRLAIPAGRQIGQAAGGAGNFSYCLIRPGATVALQIRQIIFLNTSATVQQYYVMLMSAANIAAMSGFATIAYTQLTDFGNSDTGTSVLRPSRVGAGLHTSSNNLGVAASRMLCPANNSVIWTLPDPGLVLFGNDPAGIPGLAVTDTLANDALNVAFVAREWPLPG